MALRSEKTLKQAGTTDISSSKVFCYPAVFGITHNYNYWQHRSMVPGGQATTYCNTVNAISSCPSFGRTDQ